MNIVIQDGVQVLPLPVNLPDETGETEPLTIEETAAALTAFFAEIYDQDGEVITVFETKVKIKGRPSFLNHDRIDSHTFVLVTR